MATDPILVHEHFSDEFINMMKAALARAATNGSAPPALATMAMKARLQGVLSEAVSRGADVLCGTDDQSNIPGSSFIPTILTKVDTCTGAWKSEHSDRWCRLPR